MSKNLGTFYRSVGGYNQLRLVAPVLHFFITITVFFFKLIPNYICKKTSSYAQKIPLKVIFAPERRCSSRTFRYGYLVTT